MSPVTETPTAPNTGEGIPIMNSVNGAPSVLNNIEVEVWRVTPEIAADWLEKNVNNRPQKVSGITRYVRDMRDGRWMLNGESIKFDKEGLLIDGQNRLLACIESETPFWTFVFTGLEPGAFKTLDTGVKRTFADVLSTLGYPNATTLAAAVAELWRYEQGIAGQHGQGAVGNNDEYLEVLADNEDIIDSIWVSDKVRGSVPRPSQSVFCHYVFSRRDDDLADWFFTALGTGAGLDEHDAVLHLRNRLLREYADVGSPDRRWQLAMTIKAWNCHRAEKPCKVLRWGEREDFPEIE